MNSALEYEPNTPTPVPEVLSEQQIVALTDPQALLKSLEDCKQISVTLNPKDELSAKQCAALIETCTVAYRHAEKRRTEIVKPLNKQVDDANAIWQPIVKGFQELARLKGQEVSRFIEDERQKAQRAQQKAIDDANAERARLEREAEETRKESERLRLEADRAKTVDEAEVLHQQADKLEKKADVKELKAEQVATEVVPQQAKTLDLGSRSFTARKPKQTWLLAGWDRKSTLRCTDKLLDKLVGDVSKLPPGVRFLLQHSELSPVSLNKSFGVIPFPEPFGTMDEFKGSSMRSK